MLRARPLNNDYLDGRHKDDPFLSLAIVDPNTVRLSFPGAGGRAAGLYTPSSENVWSGILRFQRNFWP